ncbi:unnamed protein product [Oikopleura dioica]|uniref:ZP domain-containing protein n=1 Tax=Oikopleura dioica TaxID=34765 RepID=E4X152_OIKDI|nr:unnamed protein product [Oikopleura dioica]
MYFEIFLVFFIRGSFADLCPANWLFEEISGECKQTNIAVVCTGNSLVVVAKVDDLYFNLPTNKESDTRLKIGTCIGATAPMRSQYIARFSINECEPEIAVKDDGIVLSWEVSGTSVSGFSDVFKYMASCEIWTDGSDKKAAEGEFEGITVDKAIIAEIVSESNKISDIASLELFEDSERATPITSSEPGKTVYARLTGTSLPVNAEFYLETLTVFEKSARIGNSYDIISDFCKTEILYFAPMDGNYLLSSVRVLDFEFSAFSFSSIGTFYLDGLIRICTFTDGVVDVASCTPNPSCGDGYTL